jgi:hypothetical protein
MVYQCRIVDDEQALDVLLADPDLLALEFEAIIAANYPAPADRPDPAPPRRWPRSAAHRAPLPRRARPSGWLPVPSRVASGGDEGARGSAGRPRLSSRVCHSFRYEFAPARFQPHVLCAEQLGVSARGLVAHR